MATGAFPPSNLRSLVDEKLVMKIAATNFAPPPPSPPHHLHFAARQFYVSAMHFIGGTFGGMTGVATSYPLDTVKV